MKQNFRRCWVFFCPGWRWFLCCPPFSSPHFLIVLAVEYRVSPNCEEGLIKNAYVTDKSIIKMTKSNFTRQCVRSSIDNSGRILMSAHVRLFCSLAISPSGSTQWCCLSLSGSYFCAAASFVLILTAYCPITKSMYTIDLTCTCNRNLWTNDSRSLSSWRKLITVTKAFCMFIVKQFSW